MNATRLYTIKYGGYGQVLSLGRVQTPTLGMVVTRTLEIQDFKPEPYWVLSTNYRNVVFTASSGKFTSKQAADAALVSIHGKFFQIVDIQKKAGKEAAPQLYDLTALQVDCNRRYGFSAEKTLQTLQSLYEKKLTTYPRVDTRYLTDDIYAKCPGILSALTDYAQFVAQLKESPLPKSSRVFNSAKVTTLRHSPNQSSRSMISSAAASLPFFFPIVSSARLLSSVSVVMLASRQQVRRSSYKDGKRSMLLSASMMTNRISMNRYSRPL